MEKIELLEKLVAIQQQHIELMQDYNNLKNSYKDLDYIKNVKIKQLNEEIEHHKEKFATSVEVNKSLNMQIADLNKQIEELQQSIPIEVVDKEQENQ